MFAFLKANVPEPEFIEPENWPPNSLDLNLIDYLGSTVVTCLRIKDVRLGSIERSPNELLGTDRTGLNRQSDRPVANQNFTGYAS